MIPSLILRNVSAAHWKFFWSLSLTAIQRNVIYRLITGCIPNRKLLNRIMPAIFEAPLCQVCLLSTDSAHHLLFHCPTKELIWQSVIFEFLWPTTSITDVKKAFLSLDFSNIWYCQLKGIKAYHILFIALSKIWLVYMRFIFDNTPIIPSIVLAMIHTTVRQTIREDQLNPPRRKKQ